MTVTRIHTSWLAEREKRYLLFIAERLPAWVSSDQLTVLGLVGALMAGLAYAASTWWPSALLAALIGLALNWFGDSLDGTLARCRGRERPIYGFFVDHSTDLLSQVFIFVGLGLSPYLRFDGACLILLSYWLAALLSFIRALTTQEFRISYYGVGPTEIRIALGLYTVVAFLVGPMPLPGVDLTPIDVFSMALFPLVLLAFSWMVWHESRALADRDARGPGR